MEKLNEEFRLFAIKIIIPAMVAISIKLAVQHKIERVSLFNAVCSFISGIGSAYLASSLVLEYFNDSWVPLVIASVSIAADKIAYWLLYKFNVEVIIEAVVGSFFDNLKKLGKK